MTTPLDWVRGAAAALPQPVGQTVDTAVDVAEGIIFADGSLPAGVDPADIYSWFHDGPGTVGYGRAAAALDTLAAAFSDYTEEIRTAQRELGSGWTGRAAEKSIDSFQPLLDASTRLERHATNAGQSVAGQITSFNDTKNRVVPVPADPPVGPGMKQFTQPFAPENLTADAAVAGYQVATYNNQDAYGGYQSQTTPQGAALPQDQAGGTQGRRAGSSDGGSASKPPFSQPGPPVTPPPTPQPPGQPTNGTSTSGTQTSSAPGQAGRTGPGQQATTTSGATTPTGSRSGTTATSTGGQPLPDALPGSATSADSARQQAYGRTPGTGPGGQATGTGGRVSGRSAGGGSGLAGDGPTGGRSIGSGSRAGYGGSTGGRAGTDRGQSHAGRGTGRLTGIGPTLPEQASGGRGGASARPGTSQFAAGPAGGSSQGDDDREHTTKYVMKTDHESELVGDLPPHAPSVIEGFGGDYD